MADCHFTNLCFNSANELLHNLDTSSLRPRLSSINLLKLTFPATSKLACPHIDIPWYVYMCVCAYNLFMFDYLRTRARVYHLIIAEKRNKFLINSALRLHCQHKSEKTKHWNHPPCMPWMAVQTLFRTLWFGLPRQKV